VASARESDKVNPERQSSASQFYIVYGRRFNDSMLDKAQEEMDKQTGGSVKLTPEVREVYKKIGGTPNLDGQYTVFGEVVEGLDVVNEIQWVDTDENGRPIEDIRIIRATVVR
jgi:peptidyl-prolyl cis-trans isomerase B (cyclophilin B)